MKSTFQLNNVSNKIKLNSSIICFLISKKPKYKRYY